MDMPRLVPAAEVRVETQAGNSRFIATIGPAFAVDEAKAFVQRMKAEFGDATHHVPAYIIGHGRSTLAHCHDDGEPSGTAGRPMLAVLQGSGLGDVVVVVTRYFGGTKLGTGGLVRAYGDAVRLALDTLPRAEKAATTTVMVEIPYPFLERVRQLVDSQAGIIVEEQFATAITLTARFRTERYPDFADALRELSHGSAEPVIVETNEATIMPVGPVS